MKNLLKPLKQIYKKPIYIFLQAALLAVGFILVSYLQNTAQIHSILEYNLEFKDKYILIQKIIIYFYTNNLSIGLLVAHSIVIFLFSYNIILTYFYFKSRASVPGLGGLTLSGIVATLGFGCAACGGVFLTSLLGTVGGAGLIALLPYSGSELIFVSIILLAYTAVNLSNKINTPLVC